MHCIANGNYFRHYYQPAFEIVRLYANNHDDISFDSLHRTFLGCSVVGGFRGIVHLEAESCVQQNRMKYSPSFELNDGTKVVVAGSGLWDRTSFLEFVHFCNNLGPDYKIVID